MSSIFAAELGYSLDDGRELFTDVTFRIRPGQHAALIGPNGSGKSTLFRLLAGELRPPQGGAGVSSSVLYMHQFVDRYDDASTVAELLRRFCTPELRRAALRLEQAERRLADAPTDKHGIDYSLAAADWGEMGGYELETLWDTCATLAVGRPFFEIAQRPIGSLSGGEQKRIVLELLFRSEAPALLLDEADNFLDIPGKRWLEEQIRSSAKTILFVSHDRALVQAAANRILTLDSGQAWLHEGGFETYAEAQQRRIERIAAEHTCWNKKRDQLAAEVERKRDWAKRSAKFSTRFQAAKSRFERFDQTRPERVAPRDQDIRMKWTGSRTGRLVLTIENLAVDGVFRPFSAVVRFGERVCLIGNNGTGKSHFVRAVVGEEVGQVGTVRLGARVEVGYFSQIHQSPTPSDAPLTGLLERYCLQRGQAMSALRRYELEAEGSQRFDQLSGGQQARFRLLTLELSGANLLVLDEPTDNLDLASVDALERAIDSFEGTFLAVSHDRWFAHRFERFLVFDADGSVTDAVEPTEELSVARPPG